jgi:hypothetical protein
MFNSTMADSSSFSVHRARPLGGSEQARAISLASAAPSKVRGLAEAGECLRVSTDSTTGAGRMPAPTPWGIAGRNWEQNRLVVEPAAQTRLTLIDRESEAAPCALRHPQAAGPSFAERR